MLCTERTLTLDCPRKQDESDSRPPASHNTVVEFLRFSWGISGTDFQLHMGQWCSRLDLQTWDQFKFIEKIVWNFRIIYFMSFFRTLQISTNNPQKYAKHQLNPWLGRTSISVQKPPISSLHATSNTKSHKEALFPEITVAANFVLCTLYCTYCNKNVTHTFSLTLLCTALTGEENFQECFPKKKWMKHISCCSTIMLQCEQQRSTKK